MGSRVDTYLRFPCIENGDATEDWHLALPPATSCHCKGCCCWFNAMWYQSPQASFPSKNWGVKPKYVRVKHTNAREICSFLLGHAHKKAPKQAFPAKIEVTSQDTSAWNNTKRSRNCQFPSWPCAYESPQASCPSKNSGNKPRYVRVKQHETLAKISVFVLAETSRTETWKVELCESCISDVVQTVAGCDRGGQDGPSIPRRSCRFKLEPTGPVTTTFPTEACLKRRLTQVSLKQTQETARPIRCRRASCDDCPSLTSSRVNMSRMYLQWHVLRTNLWKNRYKLRSQPPATKETEQKVDWQIYTTLRGGFYS